MGRNAHDNAIEGFHRPHQKMDKTVKPKRMRPDRVGPTTLPPEKQPAQALPQIDQHQRQPQDKEFQGRVARVGNDTHPAHLAVAALTG